MLIDAKKESFDMQEIQNRRFMYNPRSGTMVLGRQYKQQNDIISSHAAEHGACGTKEPYDAFIRGWIGTSPKYKEGVIHFAPAIDKNSPEDVFNRAFDSLVMFRENGAKDGTVIRAFGEPWEQPLRDIIPTPSVLRRLEKAKTEAGTVRVSVTGIPHEKPAIAGFFHAVLRHGGINPYAMPF